METAEYLVVYEEGPTSWGASVPDLPGCHAIGEDRPDVERLIKEAVEQHIAFLRDQGEPVPRPSPYGTIKVAA
jgi:predicted RNase H-like HicB family nuclease